MLAKAPLLRIVIPFITGIILASTWEMNLLAAILILAVSAIAIFITPALLHGNPSWAIKSLPISGGMVMLLWTCTGWLAGSMAKPAQLNLQTINGETIITRIDAITGKNFSTAAEATILSCPENRDALPHKAPVAITISANDYLLREGDLISFKADLRQISSLGNPDEFDYVLYMQRRGIIYSQLLASEDYDIIGTENNIFTCSRRIQRHISNCIINTRMRPETQRFLCTILLGNSAYLEPETRTRFSQAGISHILALSGLHISIIAGLIFFLLKPLCYLGLHKLRIAIAIPAIIAYLFITGMMPSATRSVIMVLFVFVAYLMHRRNSSLNALLAAALFILAFSPYSIYDVGFQLSFAAVLAILLFYDKFVTVSPRRKTLYYWVSSLTLTTVATFGTIIISAFYFHTIPLLAIISNMIILPLLPFYLCFALLHTVLLCCGMEIPEFSAALDVATSAIDFVATSISRLPFSAMTDIHISTTVLLLFIILYVVIALWIYNKKFHYAITSLVVALAIATTYMVEYYHTPASGIVIQNDFASTPIVYFNDGIGNVWCADDSIDIDRFCRNNAGFISRYNIDMITLADSLATDCAFIDPPFAFLNGYRIAVISETAWRHLRASTPIEVDYLVITSSYYGHITDLLDTFSPHEIVLSGAIYEDKLLELKKETDTLHIPVHFLRTDGAVFLTGLRP